MAIHDMVLLVTLAIFWILPAALVARLAERRGRSFSWFFVVALVVPWPVLLLITLVLPRRRSGGAR